MGFPGSMIAETRIRLPPLTARHGIGADLGRLKNPLSEIDRAPEGDGSFKTALLTVKGEVQAFTNSKSTAMDRPQTGNMLPSMYESHGGMFVAVITMCSIVATIVVGLRFYVRLRIIKRLGADDWVLAAALVYSLSFASS